MFKQLIYLLFAIFTITNASAAIVSETWKAEVLTISNNSVNTSSTTVSYNGYSAGDIITWTVTYNSEPGDHFTRYSDGANGIAERGNNDDTLFSLSCLDAGYSPDCGPSLADQDFTALYDSTSDISSIYSTMAGFLSADETIHDYFDFNNDTRSYRTSPHPDFTQYDYYADEFHMYADNRSYPEGGAGYAQLFYEKSDSEVWVSRIGFGNIVIETSISAVPIPATFWLFGSGIIGLTGLARKTKSKHSS